MRCRCVFCNARQYSHLIFYFFKIIIIVVVKAWFRGEKNLSCVCSIEVNVIHVRPTAWWIPFPLATSHTHSLCCEREIWSWGFLLYIGTTCGGSVRCLQATGGFCLWLTFSQTLTSAHTLVIFFFFPSAWHICLFGQVSSFSPACQRLYYSPLQVLNLSAQAHITPNKSKTKYYYSCNTTSSSCRM